MTKAILRIERDASRALSGMGRRFAQTMKSGRPQPHVFSFESPAALFRTLSPKRWELLEKLQGIGPVSLRGLARALDRDVKRVHEDVAVLLDVGLVARTATGQIEVPYSVIHADFDLRATHAA